MSRNLCHKSSPIPLWNLTDSQIVTNGSWQKPIRTLSDLKIVTNGSWQKPIRTLSDLKIVTNGAWQKTYPNSVGLENCHKWGVTKNLSEIFRTWKLSQQQAAVPRDEADPLHSGKNLSDPTLEPNRLKNVTKSVPQKQSDPTLEPNGLKNVIIGIWKKPFRPFIGT